MPEIESIFPQTAKLTCSNACNSNEVFPKYFERYLQLHEERILLGVWFRGFRFGDDNLTLFLLRDLFGGDSFVLGRLEAGKFGYPQFLQLVDDILAKTWNFKVFTVLETSLLLFIFEKLFI